jgi:hypothetical protein
MPKEPMAKKKGGSADRLFEKLGPAGKSKRVLTGMVRRVEGDDELIEFAHAGNCSKWVKIPADQVNDIKFLHMVPCGGHSHPLVHLFMNEPTSPDGLAFAALADLHGTLFQATAAPDMASDQATAESGMPWNTLSMPAGFLRGDRWLQSQFYCPEGARQMLRDQYTGIPRLHCCHNGQWKPC